MLTVEQREKIAELIDATAEILGSQIKPQIIKIMCDDLGSYEFNDIRAALTACRREVKGRLAFKDIIDRLPKKGGLPTADELWGQVLEYLTDESKSFVLPEIAFQALESTNGGIYELLVRSGDIVAARMAFKAAYERLSQGFNGEVKYAVRLGTDKENQAAAIKSAYLESKITKDTAAAFLPEIDEVLGLLPPPNPENVDKVLKTIAAALVSKVQK